MLSFHPLAEQELIEAAHFYERRAAGLGADFVREVERTLVRIRRRLSVIALMHLRRRPGYWKTRLDEE
jgi:hypothetical protein